MTRMLLHVCCGPCACGTLPVWRRDEVEVVPFFYNPNIHPFMEFKRRLEGMREVAESCGAKLVEDRSYDPRAWFAEVGVDAEQQCRRCIAMRLDRAAREAGVRGCDCFSTSLSISPWQDHEAIEAGGAEAAERHGVPFVYRDLRCEYAESRRLSREAGVYRQKYCGCLVSEWTRYDTDRSTRQLSER